jgi:hypothetical protein
MRYLIVGVCLLSTFAGAQYGMDHGSRAMAVGLALPGLLGLLIMLVACGKDDD